jgi:hypothetical protein
VRLPRPHRLDAFAASLSTMDLGGDITVRQPGRQSRQNVGLSTVGTAHLRDDLRQAGKAGRVNVDAGGDGIARSGALEMQLAHSLGDPLRSRRPLAPRKPAHQRQAAGKERQCAWQRCRTFQLQVVNRHDSGIRERVIDQDGGN